MTHFNVQKINFSVEKVEQEILEEERIRRYQAEVKIYFLMKDFMMVVNQNARSPEYTLKLIASGYIQTKKDFEIVYYSADRWTDTIVKGIGKVIEEKWRDELNMLTSCDFTLTEILRKKLYVTTYTIKSNHVIESDLNLFYYH